MVISNEGKKTTKPHVVIQSDRFARHKKATKFGWSDKKVRLV